jgi:hypothetical protein
MYEDIITLLTRDKSKTFIRVEKFYCSLCHEYPILNATDRPFPPVRFKNPTRQGPALRTNSGYGRFYGWRVSPYSFSALGRG